GDVVHCRLLGAEHLLEPLAVTRDGRDAGGTGVVRVAHLDRVGDRPLGLLLQAPGPAVPELVQAVGPVDDGRCAAPADLPADALGERLPVGEGVFRAVATGAGD